MCIRDSSFANKGTCSKQTNFVLNDDHTIASIEAVSYTHLDVYKRQGLIIRTRAWKSSTAQTTK